MNERLCAAKCRNRVRMTHIQRGWVVNITRYGHNVVPYPVVRRALAAVHTHDNGNECCASGGDSASR